MLVGFIIIGFFMYFVMQALAELGVMYPVNGAFFSYAYRVSLSLRQECNYQLDTC